jgi:sugar porter (SP) family MFS transporter
MTTSFTAPVSECASTENINMGYLLPVCLAATLGGLLFGYDTGVISGAIEPLTAKFSLTPEMKGWVSASVLLGCAGGVLAVGPISDRFGRRLAMMLAAIMFLVSAIGTAMPESIAAFNLFRILGGIGIGIASISTPMYIAEIVPGSIRGRMVAVNQIAIAGGIALTAFVNYFIAQSHAGDIDGGQRWLIETGWRWMFATGIAPSTIFAALILFLPESPRWLIEHNREAQARAILAKAAGQDFARAEAGAIRASLAREKGTWAELFSPALMLPLGLGVALAVLQQVTGINVFMYFGATLFKSMSQSTGVNAGLLTQVIINGSCMLFTVVAIATVDKWGRKPLMLLGAAGMFAALLVMGMMAQLSDDPSHIGNWMLVPIIVYIACFGLSVGPVTWVILAEIYPTAVRGRALGIATCALWLADFVVTQTFPMMDENKWLVQHFQHAFPFYLYGFFCLVLIGVMKFVPETKGKTLEEIEAMWHAHGESARSTNAESGVFIDGSAGSTRTNS